MTQSVRKNRIFWVQKLTVLSMPFFVLRSFLLKAEVFYDENKISYLCGFIICFLKKINLSGRFYPASLCMNEEKGGGFRIRKSVYGRIDYSLNCFLKSYSSQVDFIFSESWKIYLANYLYNAFTFIAMVESKITLKKADEYINEVFLIRHPANLVIKKFYPAENLLFKESSLAQCISYYVKPLCYILSVLFCKFAIKRENNNIRPAKPSVWVEYCPAGFVDFTFWKDAVKNRNFNIVRYFDRSDDGPLDAVKGKVAQQGFRWIDLHFMPLVKAAQISLIRLFNTYSNAIKDKKKFPLWFKIFIFEYHLWILLYEAVFKKYKVRLLIQFLETSWKQGPQVVALKSAGGIMAGFNWSHYYFPSLSTHFYPQHIYFTWGDAISEYMETMKSSARYILPSGVWINQKNLKPPELRQLSDKLEFIIAIFDNSASYDCHASPEDLSKFYSGVIDVLEHRPKWGGIVKSKNPDFYYKLSTLPKGDLLISRIKKLNKEGRVVVLDHNNTPLAAAANANLSVCFGGLNSAGIISSLYGYRSIHWDYSGVKSRHFYKIENQQIVFSSLEELLNAIVQSGNGDKMIGDFSKWRRQYNYFDDFLAAQRVGRFIQDFMEKVINTNDAECSLDYSVNKYTRENNIKTDMREEILCI